MPKGRAPQKSTATKKLKWVPMEIYRVPLNPEQAVLSCCAANLARGQVFTAPWYLQCTNMCPSYAGRTVESRADTTS
jgi:hypothetical protein